MRRVIAIDLHDTIAGYIEHMVEIHGWPADWSGNLSRMWPDVDIDAHLSPVAHAEFLWNLEPIPGALHGLYQISQRKDAYPIILTATQGGGVEEEITRQWLRRYIFDFLDIEKQLFCVGNNKLSIIRKYPIWMLIDDMPNMLTVALLTGKKVIGRRCPWNANMHIPSGRTWWEISSLLEDFWR